MNTIRTSKRKTDKSTVLWGLFFEKLLQNINAAVMVADSRGSIFFVNQKFLRAFHFEEEDVLDKNWITRIVPNPLRRTIRKTFQRIKKRKKLERFDFPTLGGDGSEGYFSWMIVPLSEKRTTFYMFSGHEKRRPHKGRSVKIYADTPKSMRKARKEVIRMLFEASRTTDPDTAKHALHVMSLAAGLAKKLNLSEKKIERLKIASLLHDLGKLAIDEKILFKAGKLDKEEFEQIKKHPRWGTEVVQLVYFLDDVIPIMIGHHENYDGSGYPNGIKGKDISLEARILSVADIYEALIADRPYRKGFTREKAIEIMESEKGWKLDKRITDIFIDMLKKGKFKEEKL